MTSVQSIFAPQIPPLCLKAEDSFFCSKTEENVGGDHKIKPFPSITHHSIYSFFSCFGYHNSVWGVGDLQVFEDELSSSIHFNLNLSLAKCETSMWTKAVTCQSRIQFSSMVDSFKYTILIII